MVTNVQLFGADQIYKNFPLWDEMKLYWIQTESMSKPRARKVDVMHIHTYTKELKTTCILNKKTKKVKKKKKSKKLR